MTGEEKLEKAAELKARLWSVRDDAASQPEGLERFIAAQEGVWEIVMPELRAGEKRGHWMWYIFPQIIGLGGGTRVSCPSCARCTAARGDVRGADASRQKVGKRDILEYRCDEAAFVCDAV